MTDQEYADEIYSAVTTLNKAIIRAKANGIICEVEVVNVNCKEPKIDAYGVGVTAQRPLTEDKSKRA